jgi:predicted double-glycine peptidase
MINLHITRQTYDYDCGAKALQTVMAYYGVDIREDKLINMLGTGENGTQVEEMISIAKQNGFLVEAREKMTINELKKFIDRGIPVIVVLQAWAERYMTLKDWQRDYDDGHYAIVIGYEGKTILFEDPSSFRRTWLREIEFLSRWHDIDERNGHRFEQYGMVLLGKEPADQNYTHMD